MSLPPTLSPALSAPVWVDLDHATPFVTSYQLSPQGAFQARNSPRLTDDTDLAAFTATPPAGPGEPAAAFSADRARQTAAFLLAYLHRTQQQVHPAHQVRQVLVRPAMPTSRTRRLTEWHLDNGGMLLRFSARPPFRLMLDVPAPATLRRLTAPLADHLACALLAGARELDHANAVAEQAVHADRAGESITESVRTWLTTVRSELPRRNHGVDALIERLRTVLTDEDSRIDAERFAIALGRAHGDLRDQLDAVRLFTADTIAHEDVAYLLFELARRHAIPMVALTASSLPVCEALPEGTELTDRQWIRVTRSREMLDLVPQADTLIRDELLVDMHTALLQAGVLCRGDDGECGAMLDDEVAQTWGFCPICRPADLAAAVAMGCVGSPQHDLPTSDGACRTCMLPLPAGHHTDTAPSQW